MSKKRSSHALKRFTNRVKQIRRAHPSLSFRAAQKRASAETKGHKVVRRLKSHKPRKPRVKVVTVTRRVVKQVAGRRKVSGIGSRIKKHVSAARQLLEQQLGAAEVQRYTSSTRKAYHRATKKAKEVRAKLRHFL